MWRVDYCDVCGTGKCFGKFYTEYQMNQKSSDMKCVQLNVWYNLQHIQDSLETNIVTLSLLDISAWVYRYDLGDTTHDIF